jgi:hypothetical protein
MLWKGYRQFTPTLAMKLYEDKGVPIHDLFRAPPDPKPLKRGRPTKAQEAPKPAQGRRPKP